MKTGEKRNSYSQDVNAGRRPLRDAPLAGSRDKTGAADLPEAARRRPAEKKK